MPKILDKVLTALGIRSSKTAKRSEDDVWRIEVNMGTKWISYPDEAAQKVKEAYLKGEESVNIEMFNRIGGTGRRMLMKYRVNFELMQQINTYTARSRDIYFVKKGDLPRSEQYDSESIHHRSKSFDSNRQYHSSRSGMSTREYLDCESDYEDVVPGMDTAYSCAHESLCTDRNQQRSTVSEPTQRGIRATPLPTITDESGENARRPLTGQLNGMILRETLDTTESESKRDRADAHDRKSRRLPAETCTAAEARSARETITTTESESKRDRADAHDRKSRRLPAETCAAAEARSARETITTTESESKRDRADAHDRISRRLAAETRTAAEARSFRETITTTVVVGGQPSETLVTLLREKQAAHEHAPMRGEETSLGRLRRQTMTINEKNQFTPDSLRAKIKEVTEGMESGEANFDELTHDDGSQLIKIRERLIILAQETARLGFTDEEKQPLMILMRRIHCRIRDVLGHVLVFVRARKDDAKNVETNPTLRFPPGGTAIEIGDLGREKYLIDGAPAPSTGADTDKQRCEFQKSYAFDAVFTDESQKEVYAEIQPLIAATHKGQNVGITCYGRTGAGKTFTMFGTQNKQGVVVRAMEHLFKLKEAKASTHDVKMTCMVAEIYQNSIVDLLNPLNPQDVKPSTDFVAFDKACTKESIDTISAFHDMMERAFKQRLTAAISPSKLCHLAIKTFITFTDKATATESTTCLSMVDLAGSERVAATDQKAILEGNEVNKALAALGSAIEKLATPDTIHATSALTNQSHVLTDMLGECFTEKGKFLMITNVSQSNHQSLEDLASLNFACRVANMKQKVSVTVN